MALFCAHKDSAGMLIITNLLMKLHCLLVFPEFQVSLYSEFSVSGYIVSENGQQILV